MPATIRIAQLSDTHFLDDGADPEGGFGYDTDAAFEAVFDHLRANHDPDLVVVTGDIADHGRAGEYRKAAEAFARFDVPVTVCPGNHDHHTVYSARIGRPNVNTSRVIELGNWAFVFVDSSAGVLIEEPTGITSDPPGEIRLHSNGSLGEREAAWIHQTCAEIDADHVFVWLHHPPAPPLPLCADAAYEAEWATLLADLPRVRGLGGGHTHVPDDYVFAGRPISVCPSFKNNFSLTDRTWLPPGYRTYEFAPDGRVTSEIHLVDDERWPRTPFGRLLMSLFQAEISYSELAEIIARRSTDTDRG